MVYKNYHKYIKKAPRRTVCPDCYHKKNAVYTTLLCADCGKPFSITYWRKGILRQEGFSSAAPLQGLPDTPKRLYFQRYSLSDAA